MHELIVFAVGIVVGVMNAVAGGGSLIGFPVLLAVGLSPLAANVTTNLVVLPGQLTSTYGYRKYVRKLPSRYLLLLVPCVVGAAIGATLLSHTSNSRFQQLVPALVMFAVLLFAFQPFLQHHLRLHIAGKRGSDRRLLLIALAVLPTAIYGGYFGAGFGFIMLAFLSFTKLHDLHQMNGLKNLAGMTIATVSVIILYSTHLIDWPIGLAMAAGNGIGGYYGARLSQRFSSRAIRVVVIVIGLICATYLCLRAY